MATPWTLHGMLAAHDRPQPRLWYVLDAAGTPPSPRLGHTVTALAHKLIMFGGADPSGPFNDTHVFDLRAD